VVGAGVAGLACARALADAGRGVTVIERARGVGGRCATRRVEGQPIDFGVLFFHGKAAGFLAALDAVPGPVISGWPARIEGAGRPCQPEAFAPGERRLAFVAGASAFPRHLARDLDVRAGAAVQGLAIEGGSIRLELEGGASLAAPTVVVALAAEQSLALLRAATGHPGPLATACALLEAVRSQPCLTVLAGYPLAAAAPTWDICYPGDSPVLQILAQDSTKRDRPAFHAMVYQAHPRWSREHLDDPRWPDAILAEAARILGPWAAAPTWTQSHRWRHARTDRSAELRGPLHLELPGGARLGLCGELFAPGGGVEAAWSSGERLARRILAEEDR